MRQTITSKRLDELLLNTSDPDITSALAELKLRRELTMRLCEMNPGHAWTYERCETCGGLVCVNKKGRFCVGCG